MNARNNSDVPMRLFLALLIACFAQTAQSWTQGASRSRTWTRTTTTATTKLHPVTGTSCRRPPRRQSVDLLLSSSSNNPDQYPTVQLNEFFRRPVPEAIQQEVNLKRRSVSSNDKVDDDDLWSLLTAPPSIPATPRPLWLVILASIPTGLIWYGYYKFCIEEELLQMELDRGVVPRGFGGYGTLGPFTYGLLLGPVASLLHLPGGSLWSAAGIVFIYYTQFLLYDRVNELYQLEFPNEEPPLVVWWCLPIFFPFNLIVGLRQVHFLSQYHYRVLGNPNNPPKDVVAEIFPFIQAPRFTWQEFLTQPRLWFFLWNAKPNVDTQSLPPLAQDFLALGDGKEEEEEKKNSDKEEKEESKKSK